MGKYSLTKSSQRAKKQFNPASVYPNNSSMSDLERYQYLYDRQDIPFYGSRAKTEMRRLENDELKRMAADRNRILGLNPSRSPYPIHNTYFGNGYTSFSQFREVFEVTEAIMSLYGMKWLKVI